MLKLFEREYEKDNVAYNETTITLFGIPIKKEIHTTTNNNIVGGLKQRVTTQKPIKVKGFNHA